MNDECLDQYQRLIRQADKQWGKPGSGEILVAVGKGLVQGKGKGSGESLVAVLQRAVL